MGRVDDNAPQRNMGQETIDDAFPPPGIGRNEPSHATHGTQTRSIVPVSNQQNVQPDEEDLYYPSRDQGKPASFPPPQNQDNYNYHEHEVHAFPPTSHQNVGMQFQHQAPPPVIRQNYGAVPMGQPVMSSPTAFNVNHAAVQNQDQPWSSSLFDCMNDPQNALITACFPCVTFGQIAEILDRGSTSCATSGMLYGLIAFCIAAPCIMSCTYRTKLRANYGLIESPAQDWIVHCFCEWCALCQEYRQLKHMGIDPAIGWLGNEARSKQQFPMAAPPGQRMMM